MVEIVNTDEHTLLYAHIFFVDAEVLWPLKMNN